MKRIVSFLTVLSLLLITLSACRQTDEPATSEAVVDSEVIASSSQTPETSAPTPEPVTEMEKLQNALLEVCQAELDALGGCRITSYENTGNFPKMVEDTYGVAAEHLTDGFVIDDDSGAPFELIVLRVTEQDAGDQGWDALSAYKDRVKEFFCERNEDGVRIVSAENEAAYRLISESHLTRSDEYLALLICEDAQGANEVFGKTVATFLREQTAQPKAVEIADGVFFVDISRPEAEGDPDPDHPGRARYVQPNQEDMSIYDTSAIIDAWRIGDPSRLSAYDRAIYDAAKEVLDDILQDNMSGFAKEAAIYEWVIQNVGYDWSHTDVMAETSRDSYTPFGGLVNREAVCLGYATTFQLLAELSGLECITVVGAGAASTRDHAWNQVRLDGEWYCVDSTWDRAYWDTGAMNGREWRYFNTTSDYMARTGHQWDYDNVPEATAEDYGVPKNERG